MLKIYFKIDNGSKYTILEESGDKTLRNMIERLIAKQKITYKNFDLYYFVEHTESTKDDVEDMDNAINLDTQLKYLSSYELDV
jgi:hypothetical protein